MVLPTGFEPATTDLEGQCSIQLSYRSFCLIWCARQESNLLTIRYEQIARPISYKRFICYAEKGSA